VGAAARPWSPQRRWQASERTPAELARAARVLALRGRRAAASLYAGGYASAFRGAGIEFDELRPYEPGDDVRAIDWNATARRGETYVRRFREERDQTLVILLDVSASMGFGSVGRSKAQAAAHAAALLAAAASHAGDRVTLVSFADDVRTELPVARGEGHAWRVIETAVTEAARCEGRTDLAAAARHLHRRSLRRSITVLLSDLRDEAALPSRDGGGDAAPGARVGAGLASLARGHDLVVGAVLDPLEIALPTAGRLRLRDPETPGRTAVLASGRARVRRAYAAAGRARRADVTRRVRGVGADCVWLRSDRDPLWALMQLVRERSAHGGVVA
jgi:uncharacterized protein (DUF58 family)